MKEYCMGIECPVKQQCRRFIDGLEAGISDGTQVRFFRKCTNQKKFWNIAGHHGEWEVHLPAQVHKTWIP